jgi:hypothetical protein
MTTKIHTWPTTLPEAIAAAAMRSVSQFYLMRDGDRIRYLATKFPNLPAAQINALASFMLAARSAGIALTAQASAQIPEVSGVPGRSVPKLIYDTFVPLLRKGNEVKKGETKIVAAWWEKP